MRTLYFDCFAGASGNMILGGLIAAGLSVRDLRSELEKLRLPEFDLIVEETDRSGISATHVTVRVPDEKKHRHLPEIEEMIRRSDLSDTVKERSIGIFHRLARAEAAVHGVDIAKVHFHEVGALDAIIDIVGSCIGFELLGIEQFASSKLHVGSGFVEMAHGKFPVPPPAVAGLLHGIPFYSTEIEGELVTPTGAAIISSVAASYGRIPDLVLEQAGYGAGTRTYMSFPNVLRVMIGESAGLQEPNTSEEVLLLEANVDDLSPEILGHFMDRSLESGALDCWFTPIHMKKNRPAVLVSVLAKAGEERKFLELFFTETSSIGVRVQHIKRHSLERRVDHVATIYGDIAVKMSSLEGKVVNVKPEFEDLKAAAASAGAPLRTVESMVMQAIKNDANSSGQG